MSLPDFCAQARTPSFEVAARTLLLAEVIREGRRYGYGTDEQRPLVAPFAWRFGVCGVGVVLEATDRLDS